MTENSKLLLVFYGDDFTGSTDALEFMTRAGARTMLFMEVPTAEELKKYGNLDAIGIAGRTRSMAPEEMSNTLEEDFKKIAALEPRHVHYKVCSTFDSSPEIGNIGVAISEGFKQFKNKFTPVLIAAPHLGRYMAFGNLFAEMGIGSNGEIFRIDHHPSMSRHPVTPANKGDLREHLALQCNYSTGLINVLDLHDTSEELNHKLQTLSKENEVIFFDGIYEHHMKILGRLLDSAVATGKPLFSVGSSGVGKAMGDFWQETGIFSEEMNWEEINESCPILILSGSVSPITGEQIDYALEHNFEQVAIDPIFLKEEIKNSIAKYTKEVLQFLNAGKSVIFHTSIGPDDQRLEQVNAIIKNFGWNHAKSRTELPKRFGQLLGGVARNVLDQKKLQRLIIAGGDTSSYTARELGIEAVEMIAPLVKGAPLCRAFAGNSPVNRIEINLKGGQVGSKTYFLDLQKGSLNNIEKS